MHLLLNRSLFAASLVTFAMGLCAQPNGVGLFVSDTQQMRWQVDNVNDNTWIGNFDDPPPCFGPNCKHRKGLAQKPVTTLSEAVKFITEEMEAKFVIIKIAENATMAPQVAAETEKAFGTMPVWGYHKLGNAEGAKQAKAVADAFTAWPSLKGLVIMPGDTFYADYDKGETETVKLAKIQTEAYIAELKKLQAAGGVLEKKDIIYAPNQGEDKNRADVHALLGTLASLSMPRTFWTKATKYGNAGNEHKPLKDKEKDFRKRWGKNKNNQDNRPIWAQKKSMLLLAQTDMCRFLDETAGFKPKGRIKIFIESIKENDPNADNYDTDLKGIAVWEFAHMNRAEIETFADTASAF